MQLYKKKPVLTSLIIITTGLLIFAAMYAYYALNLGIKPCKGLPSDAANCGDGDFGGIYFILIGLPLILFGIILLVESLANRKKPK